MRRLLAWRITALVAGLRRFVIWVTSIVVAILSGMTGAVCGRTSRPKVTI